MTIYCSALIYSGSRSPERELTDEEADYVRGLISQLTTRCPSSHSKLGFSGFAVFDRDETKTTTETTLAAYGLFNGEAKIWDTSVSDWVSYFDTVGLCAYLFTIMNDTLQAHYNQSALMMEGFWKDITSTD